MAEPSPSLRPLVVDDADLLFESLADPSLYRYLDEAPPGSRQALRDRHAVLVAGAPAGRGEVWINRVIELDGVAVGTVQATIPSEGPTSVAYVVFVAHQGRGVATAAMRLLFGELVAAHGVAAVQVEVAPANAASLAVAARLGFEPVASSGEDLVLGRSIG